MLSQKLINNKKYEAAALQYRFLYGVLPQSAELHIMQDTYIVL